MGSRRDTILLFALIALVLMMGFLARSVEGDNVRDFRASSFLTSPGGAGALYQTFRELDLPVRQRTQPYVEADPVGAVTVLIAPGESPSPTEVHAILRRVREGGTLIFVLESQGGAGPLYDSLGVYPHLLSYIGENRGRYDEGFTAQAAPHPWTAGTRRVKNIRATFADSSEALQRKGVTRLLTVGREVAALQWREGKGEVLVWASHAPLTNRNLRGSGAAGILARAAAQGAGAKGRIEFGEWYHGFRGEGSVLRGLRRFLVHHPAGHAALQAMAVLLLLLLAAGRRFGTPLPAPPARRRSPLEHVEALAGAYRQAGARRTARRLLVAGLARRLGRRAPADEAGAAELIGRLSAASPVGREAAAALQTEWKRGGDADLVSVARGVDRLLDEVRKA
ncbi:MAG TPA: DUF4350 domain-containing protein [Longimicrobium sp.]|jgi:hypothetical protein|uniref:DUF4350 domain-containing protein n=1 Tax=Longimicrobium sp. TaxID=2029185 RepID=UPI002EDB1844